MIRVASRTSDSAGMEAKGPRTSIPMSSSCDIGNRIVCLGHDLARFSLLPIKQSRKSTGSSRRAEVDIPSESCLFEFTPWLSTDNQYVTSPPTKHQVRVQLQRVEHKTSEADWHNVGLFKES